MTKTKTALAGIVGLGLLGLASVYGVGAVNTALANQDRQHAYVKECLRYHSEKSCLEFWRYGLTYSDYIPARSRS
jgi:hypothetical protein